MRQSPLLWMSLASLALAAGLYGCETPEAFHISGDGSLLASGTGGVDTTPAGGHVGTGGIPAPASGGAVGTGGFMLATGGTTIPASGGAGGRASTGGIAGGGHAGSGSGGTGGPATGGAAATGGVHAGGSVGTGGRAIGGSVGTGGIAPGTGGSGNIGAGGRGAAGGSPGVGGSAGGAVGTGPCAGLCTPATDFKFSSGTTYQSPNLGTTAVCYQIATALTIQGGGCSNCTVSSPARTVKINGATAANNGAWSTLPAKVNGGYCIQITAGAPDYTQFYTF
jgi:hypothetical protein